MNECYICKESTLVHDSAEGTLVCTECGTVQESNIWFEQDSRHSREEYPRHTREEYPRHTREDSRHTREEYPRHTREEYPRHSHIPPQIRSILHHPTDNRSEATGLGQHAYEFVKTRSGIPDYMWNESIDCYKVLTETHSFRGNIKRGVFANCLYKVCCFHNIPRSLKEISELLTVPLTLITRTSKYVDAIGSRAQQPLYTTNEDFLKMLPRYMEKIYTFAHAQEIKNKHRLEKDVVDLFMRPEVLNGRTPHTKLTTCIYYHMNTHYGKKEFCELFGLSLVTLNKSYKELLHDVSNLRCG